MGMTESTTIRWEQGSDGIVLLTLDDPTRPANTLSPDYVRSMCVVVDRLEEERDSIAGVVITSAKDTFFTGEDLLADEPKQIDLRRAADLAAELNQVRAQLRRLGTLGRPVVAAINGTTLGCGLEIALACHHCVAADAEGCLIGMPQTAYGSTSASGSVVRRGQLCTPIEALEVGLVHEVVDTVDELVPRAKEWIIATRRAPTRLGDAFGDRPGEVREGAANSGAPVVSPPALRTLAGGGRVGGTGPDPNDNDHVDGDGWVGKWPDDLYAFDLAERLLATAPALPDRPTDEQVDAWLEFVNLIHNATFRVYPPRIGWDCYVDPVRRATWLKLTALVVDRAGKALDAGVDPASNAATPIVSGLVGLFAVDMHRADDVTFRRDLLALVESMEEPWVERHWQLVATITDRPWIATSSPAWRWIVHGLRAHS
jgi:enoyl-CoA hydratase/carnithine racemase